MEFVRPNRTRLQHKSVLWRRKVESSVGSMSLNLLFWVLMILSFLFGMWSNYPVAPGTGKSFTTTLLIFILLAILGWAEFGAAVHR
jgi:hypothetical protein